MDPLLLGGLRAHPRQTADLYVAISDDAQPLLRVDIYRSRPECLAFQEAIVWNRRIFVGYGETVYIIDPLQPITSSEIFLSGFAGYFSGFYPGSDYLLVASGESLLRLTHDGRVLWVAHGVGLDGVVVRSVENGVIHGEGEWDPPGGWKPFAVHLDSGRIIRDR